MNDQNNPSLQDTFDNTGTGGTGGDEGTPGDEGTGLEDLTPEQLAGLEPAAGGGTKGKKKKDQSEDDGFCQLVNTGGEDGSLGASCGTGGSTPGV